MKPSQKTSPRQIRDKKAITRSQWEFRQKTRKLPEARKNVKGLSAKKQNKAKNPQKNQFLALQLTIFNRPLLHLTHSPVPSTVNEEFLKKNVIYRNISPVKRKVEYSLNTLWVLGMMSCAGWVTCPVLGSWCHGDANSCARSLSISVPRSLMMVVTGAALRLSREQKKAFRRYSVCWLWESSNSGERSKLCSLFPKKKWIAVKRRTTSGYLTLKWRKLCVHAIIVIASARAFLCPPGSKRP